jgi:flagellar motor switch protein FliM
MREEVMNAEVEISSTLTQVTLSLDELSQLEKGDIIPIELPEEVVVDAASVPIFRARLGVSDGYYSLKITHWIDRSADTGLHEYLHAARNPSESKTV